MSSERRVLHRRTPPRFQCLKEAGSRSTKRPTELPGARRAGRFPAERAWAAAAVRRVHDRHPNSLGLADNSRHDCRSSARGRRISESATSCEYRIGLETDMAGGAWFAHFRAPVPDLSVPKPPPQWASSSDRDLEEGSRPASNLDDPLSSRLVSSGARLNQPCKTIPNGQ